MADLFVFPPAPAGDVAPPFELDLALEALHFAFRAVIARPDAVLADQGLSRVHHRILYFVRRHPGISVNGLLGILQISKQALHGPLRQLAQRALVVASPAPDDRRVRCLHLSDAGARLEEQLSADQRDRFARVFARLGQADADAWLRVMHALADREASRPLE